MKITASLMVLLGTATFLSTTRSLASSWYTEVGGGAGQIRSGEEFFGNGTESSSSLGGAVNAGVYFNPWHGNVAEAQFGLHSRMNLASSGPNQLMLLAPYLISRVQVSRLYVGIGAAPLVWGRASPESGFTGITRGTGGIGLMGEAGLLWPVTPEFSLGATGAVQTVLTSGVRSPLPAWDLGASMRFYFGISSGGGSKSSNEFEGWRYPFGWQKGK